MKKELMAAKLRLSMAGWSYVLSAMSDGGPNYGMLFSHYERGAVFWLNMNSVADLDALLDYLVWEEAA